MDTFRSMTDLLEQLPAENHYRIDFSEARHSLIAVFAPHAGCIEPCTGDLVREIASEDFNYYLFHGMMRMHCYRTLHVASTRYDEPSCCRLADQAMLAVALHGCDGDTSFIEVGGGNTERADHLRATLFDRGFQAVAAPHHRRGEDERNFINRARHKGIQIELSAGFRRSLFPDFPRTSQRNPKTLPPFIQTMKHWLQETEAVLKNTNA